MALHFLDRIQDFVMNEMHIILLFIIREHILRHHVLNPALLFQFKHHQVHLHVQVQWFLRGETYQEVFQDLTCQMFRYLPCNHLQSAQ